jgi:hypothetical protein
MKQAYGKIKVSERKNYFINYELTLKADKSLVAYHNTRFRL